MEHKLFADPGPWYLLNPDFRKDAPKTGPWCCRCQRPLKSITKGESMRLVEVDWDRWLVRNNPLGKDLLGSECFKQVFNDENQYKPE